mgnify:CR=1 FL=1
MTAHSDAYRAGLWGGTGSGKSTQLREMLEGDKRHIVLDPMGDWQYKRGYRNYTTYKGLLHGIRRHWDGDMRLVMTVDEERQDLRRLLQDIARDLMKIQGPYQTGHDKRQITLVIDEMADFYPNINLSPDMMSFQKLCRKGRHYGINVLGASQRLAEVHTSFRGNCRENYFFRQDEAVDIERALQSLGKRWRGELESLREHDYLLKRGGEVSKGRNRGF